MIAAATHGAGQSKSGKKKARSTTDLMAFMGVMGAEMPVMGTPV